MENESADNRKLDREILADAKAQAQRNIKKAEREADAVIKRAKKDANNRTDEILTAAKKRAAGKAAVIEASIEVEAKRVDLAAREDVIQSILEDALRNAQEKSGFDYKETIIGLGAEAVAKMSGDSFTITLNGEDADSIGEQVVKAVAGRIRAQSGRDVRLVLAGPAQIGAGIIVETADRRERVNSTFDKRLERFRDRLRIEVGETIFPEDK